MMTIERITQVASACAKLVHDHAELLKDVLEGKRIEAKRLNDAQMCNEGAPPLPETLAHLLFMCDEIGRMAVEANDMGAAAAVEWLKVRPEPARWYRYAARREKAMRWIGFVQGALWALDAASIFQLKRMNAPEDSQPEPAPAA